MTNYKKRKLVLKSKKTRIKSRLCLIFFETFSKVIDISLLNKFLKRELHDSYKKQNINLLDC